MRRSILTVALASLASGQVLYRTEFHTADGWTFDFPEGNSEWKVDALPAATPNGPFRSPPFSLNYNEDTFWYDLDFSGRSAWSPPIDLSLATGQPVLTFWCNNQMAEAIVMCDNHESARVRVESGGNTVLERCLTCEGCYQNWAPISPCVFDQWHKHTLLLDKSWGVVQVAFMTQGDDIFNSSAGYFVDDLSVLDAPVPTSYCTAKTNSQGCQSQILAEGVPEFTPGAPFLLTAAGAINQQPALLFYSLVGPANTPALGGTLCVQPPLVRTPVTTTGGNPPPADCSGQATLDFNAWIEGGADPGLVPGVSVYAQFFYRDPADPFTAGLTDGIAFTILP